MSIIIPVYKVEQCIRKCLDSVLNQTYRDYEIILVDDGSPDGCPAICDSYAQNDKRVRVIHKENGGAGAARNDGIKQASGEYIVFVDSDDFIEPDYLALLSKHSEDLVFIDVDRVDSKGNVVGIEYMSKYKHLAKDELLRRQMTGRLPWGGVRKCIKRQLLIEYQICYSNHKIGEEAIYSYLVLRHAKTIGFIEKPVYHYLQHGDSLSNSTVDDPWGEVALALREKVEELGDYEEYGDTVNAFIETAAIVSAYKMAKMYPLTEYMRKADIRWMQMLQQKDLLMATDRKHQSSDIRLFGLIVRMRQWPLAWIIGLLRQR